MPPLPLQPRFQSTHPHGVRLGRVVLLPRGHEVSIHAPTWGATTFWCVSVEIVAVSIHAPTWGATQYPRALMPNDMFQSTHPRGVRQPYFSLTGFLDLFQSTHPRGVRLAVVCFTLFPYLCFNPRTHVGCDKISIYTINKGRGFNPRTHVGCDLCL